MKTVEDLKHLRTQYQERLKLRHCGDTKITVGMGTCGIAAGARDVMFAFLNEIARLKLEGVTVLQTDCAGKCKKEVLVEVDRCGERVVYGRVGVRDVARIVGEHVVNGNIVEDMVLEETQPGERSWRDANATY